jgi:ABC-2 type transport system permease protein
VSAPAGSAGTARAPRGEATRPARRAVPVGAATMVRFMLRRERRGLPIWIVATGALVLVQSVQSQSLYDTAEALAKLRATTEGNSAVVAMSGPAELLENVGGEVIFEIFAFAGIVVALMNMFLVGRHTRADEETGRSELLRSARVDRRALLVAALAVAALADVAVAAVVTLAAAGTGLPLQGSVLFGVAMGCLGLVFAGLTAAAAQVFENTRGVYGAVTALLGFGYALRAAGDSGTATLSWLSPFGWGQRTLPYVANRWWPVAISLVAAGALVALSLVILERRDLGAGVVPSRPGRARASRTLGSPLGLAWRLQRSPLIAWVAGAFGLGVMYGSIGKSIEQYVADNPEFAEYLPGGAGQIVDSYLAITLGVSVLLAVGYGLSAVLRARSEETAGRVEPVLATPTARPVWLGSHVALALGGSALVLLAGGLGIGLTYGLSISEPGETPRTLAAATAYLPATLLAVAVAATLVGLLPRVAGPVAWTFLGYLALVALLGDSLDLPGWSRALSPLDHTPRAPLDDVAVLPLAVMVVLTVAAVAAGLAGIRARDLETT